MQAEKNVKLIDVRTDWEFKKGHLRDAVNIDWMGEDFLSRIEEIPKSTTVFVYCYAGGRSMEAARKLLSIGYLRVINLEGGYDSWKKAKLPVTQ
jgi:rhodanese-related sulfurtransferase